jgi:glucose-6-phosphate 1-dehydrogenase
MPANGVWYLAVPAHAYHTIIKELALGVVHEIQVKMIVVDIDRT